MADADPANPKPGDRFNDGTEIRVIRFVGARLVLNEREDTTDERANAKTTVATWTPAPQNYIAEDTILYEYRVPRRAEDSDGDDQGWATLQYASVTGRSITVHADHTWEENG